MANKLVRFCTSVVRRGWRILGADGVIVGLP